LTPLPTGDHVLDEILARSARIGRQASLRRYLRAFGLRGLPKLIQSVSAQLEEQGLLSLPTTRPTRFGLRDRRHVQREPPNLWPLASTCGTWYSTTTR
jgi:hypothetical protein